MAGLRSFSSLRRGDSLMRQFFRSVLRRFSRTRPSPIVRVNRWRPQMECLEDRTVPSITLPTPGQPGPATLMGGKGQDQFLIRLQSNSPNNIQFSDDNGQSFSTAALSDVQRIVVKGLQGKDTLTLDVTNGLLGTGTSGGLPISFDGGSGQNILRLIGNATGNITESFTLGANSTSGILTVGNGSISTAITLTNVSGITDT